MWALVWATDTLRSPEHRFYLASRYTVVFNGHRSAVGQVPNCRAITVEDPPESPCRRPGSPPPGSAGSVWLNQPGRAGQLLPPSTTTPPAPSRSPTCPLVLTTDRVPILTAEPPWKWQA